MFRLLEDSGLTWAYVLRIWNELDVPEGWRPEITPEGIVISPPPSGTHNRIAGKMDRVLVTGMADDRLEVFQTQGVAIQSVGGVFIPDLCVVAGEHVPPGSDPVAAQHVLLAVEITSRSNAERDRKRKKWAYAHGPIAQYLLIDAFDEDGPMLTLFSNPQDGIYRNSTQVPFGHSLKLAPPVEVVVDGSVFPSAP